MVVSHRDPTHDYGTLLYSQVEHATVEDGDR